jgi:RHS repeat-associated protein
MFYQAQVVSITDYDPFGMLINERTFSATAYRFGFQGQEKDDDIKGCGNTYSFEYRILDVRGGRFFSIDPLSSSYPWNSPYAFSENRVIDGIDFEGLEFLPTNTGIFRANVKIQGPHVPSAKQIMNNMKVPELLASNLPDFYKNTVKVKTLSDLRTSQTGTSIKLANMRGKGNPAENAGQATALANRELAKSFLVETQAYNFTLDQEAYFNQSKAIVEKAAEQGLIPGIFSSSASLYSDLVNFIYNGTELVGDDKKTQAYNGVLRELGLELFNNKTDVLTGEYKRPVEPIIYTPPPQSGLDGHTPSPPPPIVVPSKTKLDEKVKIYIKTEGCVNCTKVDSRE